MGILDKLFALLRELHRQEAEYALFGGMALNLYGLVRATEDIGLFLKPEASNVERLKCALRNVWDDPDIEEIRQEDLLGDCPAVQYGPPGESFTIDVVTRLGTAVLFDDLEVTRRAVEEVPVSLVTPSTLYRMKRATVRPVDQMDALRENSSAACAREG